MRILFLSIITLASFLSFSQTKDTLSETIVISDLNTTIKKEQLSPFIEVENIPLFHSCDSISKSLSKKEKLQCFKQKMTEYIQENFFYPKLAQDEHIEGRVTVRFIIDEEGNVTNIKAVGGHKYLKDAACKIVSLMPKFIPGSHKGKPVKVSFLLPLVFKLTKTD